MFLEIVKMIDDEQVKLIVDEDNDIVTIKTASDEFKLKGIPASEYVASPTIEDGTTFSFSPEIFLKGIEKVEYAVTEKNFAPVLTGILLRLKKEEDGNKLVFVGTDSFRLAEYKVDYP
jgi:DNA polymerase III sliding clamp (beta) subunit (PCNA family)